MFTFTCWKCGKDMKEAELEFTDKTNGETFTVKTMGIVCENGHKNIGAPQMDAYNIAFADAYRKKHGLLTTMELLLFREEILKKSQQDFADYIGVHVQSVKKWEHGCVQKESSDKLIRNKIKKYLSADKLSEKMEYGRGSDFQLSNSCKHYSSEAYNDFTQKTKVKEINDDVRKIPIAA